MADHDSIKYIDESGGDEDEQAQHPGEGRDADEEHTDRAQQPRSHHAGGEGPGQVEEYELAEIVIHGPHDDNLLTTEHGRDGADSQGRARHLLDGEVDKESQASDEEHEVTYPLLPEQPDPRSEYRVEYTLPSSHYLDREAVEESQDEEPGDTDPLLPEPPGAAAPQGGSVTGWKLSNLFEDIKSELHKLEASIPDGDIDYHARIDTFNEIDSGNVTDNHYQKMPKEKLLEKTDTKIHDMIRKWARRYGGNRNVNILDEEVMVEQLAKFQLRKSIGALLDVILAEGGSEKKDKGDEWAVLFKQLGGLMLFYVFRNTDRLKKITTSQCNNPLELVKVFVQVMKQASNIPSNQVVWYRDTLGSTIDGSIAAIISLMKTNASTLLLFLKDILNDLDAICFKWMDEHEEEHADIEESEKKEEDKEKDSQRNQDLSIDCFMGEKVMIKQLTKFQLKTSVGALLDVILAEGGSEKKEKDDEWAHLFKQLGGLMLLHVFVNTDRLKKITTSQCCNPSELVKKFVQVIKQASETPSNQVLWNLGVLESTIDGSIADIISLMKTNASTLLLKLKYILNDLDAICSKGTDEHEEELADVEVSEEKEENKETEKDSHRTESPNMACLRDEIDVIFIKLANHNLTASVKALMDVLLSVEEDDQEEYVDWNDLFKHLGPGWLQNVFGQDSGPLFMKIIKSKRWCRNPILAETIFDGMVVESHIAFGLLNAPVDRDNTKTVFTELATSCNSLCSHELLQRYTKEKREQLGPYCILLFVLYLCMTFSLICTLVTSVMAVNVHIYESGLDHSRLVFEVIAAISVIGCLLIELYQIKRSRWDYFTDWDNWLELLSSLLLCISIPLRFTAKHVHWYLFAFGYLLWIPQWRKQSVVFKKFYIQAEIVVQVLKHDVPWFSLLFLVINIAFAGASYLTLRGENNLHVDNQTSSFQEIFFMGVRTLAEGQPVFEYYGNEEYRTMSIAVMVVFLFAMCVILLNLLIAQISKTLDKKSETMDNNYHIRLACTLSWMDILLPECCKKLGKTDERLRNVMARPELYKEKIISNTEKMGQHLAKIAGDLQDVSKTFSIRVKDNDVNKRRRNQTVGGDVSHIGCRKQGRESQRREEWNKIYNDKKHHEGEVLDFIEICSQEGHNPAEWMVDDQCPLYVAVEKNRFKMLRRLLGLLDPKSTTANERKEKALYRALQYTDRFHEAALLVNNLKTSEPQRVLDCFDNEVNLYHDCNYSNEDFWLALLDVMMIQKDLRLLDKNVKGKEAEGTELTICHRLADRGNTTVFKHAALKLYIQEKWMECGRKKQVIFDMLIYLVTLVCLTVVVVLSGQAEDVNSYQTKTDRTRLGFEIVSASLILYTLVKEVQLISTLRLEFKYVYAGMIRRHIESRWWFIRKLQKYAVWKGIRAYWKDHFNKAECTSTLMLLPVTITARLIDTNGFWYIFAFGYFLWVMVVFKYASIHRELSTYAQSLWIIITTDVFYFLVLFAVVNLAFSGFFVLILKGENIIHVQKETITFWGTLFFGVRVLTDGQNSLNYYDANGGPDGYNTFLTVATMVVFLFVMLVILSNILIAQLSRSYYNVQEDAEAAALVRKARDIARLERFEWPYCIGPLKSKAIHRQVVFDNDATFIDNKKNNLIKKLDEVESKVLKVKAEATRYIKVTSETENQLQNKLSETETQLQNTLKKLRTTIDSRVKKLETDTGDMNNLDELKKVISIEYKAMLDTINDVK